MTISTIPTRNPADLGAALYDARTPDANELAAVNVEKIKDRLIEVVTEVGLTSGATAGSINEMRAAFTSGAYDAILRHTGLAYRAQRLGGGVGAPTVADDSGEGYAPGSWWVQVFGLDNPSTLAFFLCIDASEGAAVWVQIKPSVVASDADPIAPGVADPGTSEEYARADHVHPSGRRAVHIEEGSIEFQSRPAAVTSGDFASIPGTLVPDAGPWTLAFFFTPTSRHSAGGILAAKWDNGGTRGFVAERYGDGVIVWFNAGSNFAYTLDTIFVAGTEREIAIAFNGAGATSADRIKISSRTTGGTWTAHTLTFSGTIPTSITVSGAPVTFARAFGSAVSAASANFRLRDLRILSTAVTPSGTSDLALTSLSSRYRFRSLVGATTPDEITGAPMTLTHTLGGPLRPVRSVASWQAGTYPLGPRILTIGNSKTSGSSAARGAWRHEACNQLAAVWGHRPTFVGRFADADARADFVYNSRHSGLGGALLNGTILTRCTDDVVAYAPDVVVLEGGTNDALAGASATTIRDRMGACVDAVLSASATCKVIVMSDPTVSAITLPTEYAVLATYNGLLAALAASKGSRVSFVDVYPLTCEDYLWDAAHMLEPGYARIGEAIAEQIALVL